MGKKQNAEFVRAARAEMGLDQPEFASRLGVSPRTVAGWETGDRVFKRLSRLAILALLNLSDKKLEGSP
jgi:DNA-binding transcriptional regulator YiaG